MTGGQEGDRSGLGRRARGIVVRIGENVVVAVVFAVRSALLLTFLLFSDGVRKKKRNFALAKSKSAQSTGEVGEWLKPAVC